MEVAQLKLPQTQILLAYGTRPEAVKLGPVAAELKAANVPFGVLATGQHTELLAGTPAESDLAGGHALALPSRGYVLAWMHAATGAIEAWLKKHPEFDPVVVQGDTMSAVAVAQAAVAAQRAVAHVEAGVRSHALEPWPEEANRRQITRLARWHYAPTAQAYANLVQENVPESTIVLTGNPGVSAIARYSNAVPRSPLAHVLVTLHRREWLLGALAVDCVASLCSCVAAEPRVEWFWPMHPHVWPQVKEALCDHPKNLIICDPLPYNKCVHLLASALGVLTDSGGIQEEAATLGVPCAVLRTVLDRPESVQAGVARRFEPDALGVRDAVRALLGGTIERRAIDDYGAPDAAARIARHLAQVATVR